MSIAREIQRGLRGLQRQLGQPTFIWQGKTIPCSESQTVASQTLGPGGFTLEADLTLFVLAADMPSPGPQELHTVTYKGLRYRIDKRAELPGASGFKLVCNKPSHVA